MCEYTLTWWTAMASFKASDAWQWITFWEDLLDTKKDDKWWCDHVERLAIATRVARLAFQFDCQLNDNLYLSLSNSPLPLSNFFAIAGLHFVMATSSIRTFLYSGNHRERIACKSLDDDGKRASKRPARATLRKTTWWDSLIVHWFLLHEVSFLQAARGCSLTILYLLPVFTGHSQLPVLVGRFV